MMDYPRLIENSSKNYLFQTLQKCHNNRVTIYYYVLNIGVLVLFFGIVGSILYYSYKNKLSPYEAEQKMINDQEYIMSKIRYYKEDTKKTKESQSSFITDLPKF
jgi:type IV secretory pathway TrbF-like protein